MVVMFDISICAEEYTLPNHYPLAVTGVRVKNWECPFGLLMEIQSNQGRKFKPELFQKMCATLMIGKNEPLLHPQTDGMLGK